MSFSNRSRVCQQHTADAHEILIPEFSSPRELLTGSKETITIVMFEIQEELEITGGTCENKIWYKYIMASGRQKG